MDASVTIQIIQDEITSIKLQMDEIEGADEKFSFDRWQKLQGQLELLERIQEKILKAIDDEIEAMYLSIEGEPF